MHLVITNISPHAANLEKGTRIIGINQPEYHIGFQRNPSLTTFIPEGQIPSSAAP